MAHGDPQRSAGGPPSGQGADQQLLRSPIQMIAAAVGVLLISLILYLLVEESREDTSSPGARRSAPDTTLTLPSEDTSDADAEVAEVDTPAPVGPYVEATLEENSFVLAGVVPSAALATKYLRAAEIAYSPYVRSELMVDEQLQPVDWLGSGPDAIVLLPIVTDGTILISDGQVEVSGRSPDDAGVDRLEGALAQITGLPVVVGEFEVTGLNAPSYVIAADAGRVELSGRIPTDEIRAMLVDGAVAAYGQGNVEDRISIDPGVYPSLWMYNGGPLMQAMSVFPDYELRIDGTAFSGFINGGVTFAPGSAEFSGAYAQVLDVGEAS